MRAAVVTTSYPVDEADPSGHFVRTEVRALVRAGHEVHVVTPTPGGAFGWPGAVARVRENPLRAVDAARWISSASAELRTRRFDRVIAHWSVPSAFPIATGFADATSFAGATGFAGALEVVSHGGDVRLLAAMPRLLREAVVRRIASRAEAWRFVSAALRDELLATLGPRARALVLGVARLDPSPIELPNVAGAAARLRSALGERVVAVTVGRLVKAKRVDRVIDHVAHTGQLLVIVGDGPERDALEALASARRVDARFVGKLGRPDALAWIAAADVLLHASSEEGLSTVIREADALGVPVTRL